MKSKDQINAKFEMDRRMGSKIQFSSMYGKMGAFPTMGIIEVISYASDLDFNERMFFRAIGNKKLDLVYTDGSIFWVSRKEELVMDDVMTLIQEAIEFTPFNSEDYLFLSQIDPFKRKDQ